MSLNILLKFFDRFQLYLWPIFGVLTVIFLSLLVILPQASDLIESTKAFSQTSAGVKKLEQKLAQLESLNEEELKGGFTTALSVLPEDRDYISSLSQLQILTTANNLRIDDVSFGNSNISTDQKNNSFLIRLTVLGTQEQIQQLISQLRNSPRIMSVEDIELVGSKASGPTQVTLTLKTYYEPGVTTLGDISSDLTLLSSDDQQLLDQLNQSLLDVPITLTQGLTGSTGKVDPFH